MIRRPTCAGRLNATEPKFSQIEGCNEGVDHANRIVICNPVVQAFRQQSRLPAISSLNETSHASPPPIQCGNHSRHGVFTQPGSQAVLDRLRGKSTEGPEADSLVDRSRSRPPSLLNSSLLLPPVPNWPERSRDETVLSSQDRCAPVGYGNAPRYPRPARAHLLHRREVEW